MPISVGSSSGLQARSVSSSTKASLGIGERIATQGAIKTASSQGLKAVKSAALSTAVSKAATTQIKTTASSSGLKAVSNISKTTSTVLNRLNNIGTSSTNNIQSTVNKATKQITNRTASIPVLESKVQAVSISTVKPNVVATNADSIKKAINDVYGEYKLAETNILTAADRGLSANKNVISKSITNAKSAQDVANIQDIGEKSISAISNLAGNLTSKLNNSTSAAIRVLTDNSAKNLQAIVPPSMGNILTPVDSSLQLNRNDLQASLPSTMKNIISSTKSPMSISKNNLRATVSKQFTIKPGTSIKMNTPISSIPIVTSAGKTMSISDLDTKSKLIIQSNIAEIVNNIPTASTDEYHVLTNVPIIFDTDAWDFKEVAPNWKDGELIDRGLAYDDKFLQKAFPDGIHSYGATHNLMYSPDGSKVIGATFIDQGANQHTNITVEGDEYGISELRDALWYLRSTKNKIKYEDYKLPEEGKMLGNGQSNVCYNFAMKSVNALRRIGIKDAYTAVVLGSNESYHAVVAIKTGERSFPDGSTQPIFALIEPQPTGFLIEPALIGVVGGDGYGNNPKTYIFETSEYLTDVGIIETPIDLQGYVGVRPSSGSIWAYTDIGKDDTFLTQTGGTSTSYIKVMKDTGNTKAANAKDLLLRGKISKKEYEKMVGSSS